MDYNGWTNRSTWMVNLWLSETLDLDKESFEITPDYIESLVDEMLEDSVPAGFPRDMLNCALGLVNYNEIARHYACEAAA